MTRYRCADAQQAAGFPVSRACETMRISTSAFYTWRARGRHGPSSRAQRDAGVLGEIREIHDEHPDDGSPRVTAELARRGTPCNHKKVATMMRDHRIVARRHRGRRRGLTTPDPTAPALPDLVGRLFDPDDINHTWAGDVTYVPTAEGWLYLASVLDLGSRRLIGYAMSATADTTTSSTRWRWPSRPAAVRRWMARSFTQTAGRPTPRAGTARRVLIWGWPSRPGGRLVPG